MVFNIFCTIASPQEFFLIIAHHQWFYRCLKIFVYFENNSTLAKYKRAIWLAKNKTNKMLLWNKCCPFSKNSWFKLMVTARFVYLQYFSKAGCMLLSLFFFWASCYCPLQGRTRSRGRCWASIRLSHRPEASGRAVHVEVDGFDIGGQNGRRFVPLRHIHRPQKRPYPIFVRSGNVRHRCGGGYAGPMLSL